MLTADPEPARAEDAATGFAGVRDDILARDREAFALAERVAGLVANQDLPDDPDSLARADLFSTVLAVDRPAPVAGLVVRDASGAPVAWAGRVFDSPLPVPGRPVSGLVTSRMYRVLFAEAPISGSGGAVQVFSPLDVRFPLHNRYLRGANYEAEAARRFGLKQVEVRLSSGDPFPDADSAGRAIGEVRNQRGDLLARLAVTALSPEERRARLDHARLQVRSAILAALLLLGFSVAVRRALSARGGIGALLLFVAAAVAARVGLLLVDFPGGLVGGPAFAPESFSLLTPVLGLDLGLLDTPGEAAITGFFAAAILAVALFSIRRLLAPLAFGSPRPRAALPVVLAALLLVAGGTALWLRLLHAFTFFSTVEFFPEAAILPPLPASALLVTVFLLTLVLLGSSGALLCLAARLACGARTVAVAGFLVVAAAPVFGVLRLTTDLSVALAALLSAAIAGTAAVFAGWRSLGSGLRAGALAALVAVASFLPFVRAMWRESLSDVEEQAEDLFRPGERGLLLPIFEADLDEIASDPELTAKLTAGDKPPEADAAFQLWARSALSRQPRGAEVEIRDRIGERMLSRFEIDMPPRSWLPDPPDRLPAGERFVGEMRGRGAGERARFLFGAAPVLSPGPEREVVGQVRVRMPADRPAPGAPPRPEVLREREDEVGRETKDLHYAEFDGADLRFSTNPAWPHRFAAAPEVRRAILGEGRDRMWFREEIGGVWTMNHYRPRFEDGRVAGLSCVGFRSRDLRTVLFWFCRFFLLAALVAGVLLAATVLARWPPRLRFQHKLIATYVIVAGLPVLFLAEANRTFARESVEEQMNTLLRRSARQVAEALRAGDLLPVYDAGVKTGLPAVSIRASAPGADDTLKEIGYRLDQEINVFLRVEHGTWGARLIASSEPGLFLTELFNDRLSGAAYRETVLLGREFHAARESAGDYSYLVGYTPIRDESHRAIGAVSLPLLYGQDAVDRELGRRNSLLLALYLMTLLVVIFIGMVLARRISSPIERLVEATGRLSAGDLSYRVPGGSGDEFGYLVRSFNRMTEDLRASRDQLVRAERDAAWREMARQIAHEIKNPLTPMRLSAQHLKRAFDDGHPEFPEILARGVETIIRQTDVLKRIAGEFSAFARLPMRSLAPVDAAAVARETAGLFRGSTEVSIVEEIAPVPPVMADADDLRRVLVNLATNSVQAMEGRPGVLMIRVREAALAGKRAVEVTVTDTGTGIAPEDMGRLFEPSFSTKKGGTGLGLAISRAVVVSFGGEIAIRSEPGRGTTVTVTLPAAPPAP
jgi:signal transduction histidine kinase